MKLLPAVLLAGLVIYSEAIRLPDPSWAVEVETNANSNSQNSARKLTEDLDCSNKIFSCNGCKQSLICRPQADSSIVSYAKIDCPPERQFCDLDSGSCSSKVRLDCGEDDTFICTEKDHFFPDKDCTAYHYCNSNYKASLFRCVEGQTFNADTQKCQTGGQCGSFACTGNDLTKVAHSQYQRYYAMCKTVVNDDTPLVVALCPPQFVLNSKTQIGCEVDCATVGIGNIPDPQECTKYWTCSQQTYPNGETFMVADHLTCANGQFFDSELRICITGVPDENCKKTSAFY